MLPCSLIHAYIPLYLTMEIWMIIKILVLQWNWFILLVHCHVHWNSLKLPKSTNIEATFRQFLPTLQKKFYLKMSEQFSCIFGEQKVKCYWWWSRNMMAILKFLFHYHRYLKIMKNTVTKYVYRSKIFIFVTFYLPTHPFNFYMTKI